MSEENSNLNKFGDAIIQKFINEEIMTKSELDQKLEKVMAKYITHMDLKFEHIDRKFEHIDRKFDHIDRKFDHIEQRFEQVDKRFAQVDKRFAQMDIRYNWVIGLIVTATIGIISIVIKLH